MRLTILLVMLLPVAAWAEDKPVADPAMIQVQVAAAAARDPDLLAAIDLDGDGKVSRIEALVWLYGHQSAAREHIPAIFASIDSDGDRALSREEIMPVFAKLPADAVTVQVRQPSVHVRAESAIIGGGGTSMGTGSAYIYVGNQQAYVQGYNVVNGQYQPVIGILATGTVLEVSDLSITIHRN